MVRKNDKEVLIISKPIVPPWNDSGKNIAKELVTQGERYTYRILTTQNFSFADERRPIRYERIYPSSGSYQAGIRQNLKVMFCGLRKKDARIYHYFFAPNPTSATAGRLQRALTRVKTVQTFCSRPADYSIIERLIFTDKVIVLSAHTHRQLLDAGVDPKRVVHIPPGIVPPPPLSDSERRQLKQKYALSQKRVVLFPGDFEFSTAASQVAAATASILSVHPDVVVVFACRAKTGRSREQQQRIKMQLAQFGERVRFPGEIDDMPRLVGCAEVIVLPQDDLYAKMDIPLVLLEGMGHAVPLIVADAGPLRELIAGECAIGSKNAASLTDAVTHLLTHPNDAERLGQQGKTLVHTTYNATQMAKAVENLYDELLDN